MGGSFSSFDSGYNERDSKEYKNRKIIKECGVQAIANILLCEDSLNKYKDFKYQDLKTLSLESQRNNIGLKILDIGYILNKYGYIVDMRFNSQVRTFDDFPLPSFVNGIAGIKEKKSNSTHWAAWIDGKLILDSGVEYKDIRQYSLFDGFGHRIALWKNKSDFNVMLNTHGINCSSEYCNFCHRRVSCVDFKEKGFGFTSKVTRRLNLD